MLRRFFTLLFATTSGLWSQGIISTYAGTTWVFPHDSIPGTEAPLGRVNGVAANRAGVIHFADSTNHIVFRLNENGTITRVVGNGIEADGRNCVDAPNCSISAPRSLAFDPSDNLYVVTSYSVNRITPDGVMTALVSRGPGPFNIAASNWSSGIACDSSGNVYLSLGNQVYRIGSGTAIGCRHRHRWLFRRWRACDGSPTERGHGPCNRQRRQSLRCGQFERPRSEGRWSWCDHNGRGRWRALIDW